LAGERGFVLDLRHTSTAPAAVLGQAVAALGSFRVTTGP
jgi:hypothetical protein